MADLNFLRSLVRAQEALLKALNNGTDHDAAAALGELDRYVRAGLEEAAKIGHSDLQGAPELEQFARGITHLSAIDQLETLFRDAGDGNAFTHAITMKTLLLALSVHDVVQGLILELGGRNLDRKAFAQILRHANETAAGGRKVSPLAWGIFERVATALENETPISAVN